MYNDTVTLFCRSRSANGDTWYPYVLTGVNLNIDKAAIAQKYGSDAQDNAVMNVRYGENMAVGSYTYCQPKEWQRLQSKTGKITFTPGAAFDFFWEGTWTGNNPIADENYGDLNFYQYMTQNYDNVFAITSVGFFSVIPHFEVVGR